MDSMVREWKVFLDRCLNQRVQADVFDRATAQLHQKSPLPGPKLAGLLLKPRSPNANSVDPRVIIYLERLLALKKVDASDVLSATFYYSKNRLSKSGDGSLEKDPRWSNSPELEELVCHRLQRAFAAEERPVNTTEGLLTLIVVTRWMQAMVTSHTSDTMMQAMGGISQQPQQHPINVREALGVLVVGLIENSKILTILNHPTAKDLRKRVARSLASFVPFLSHNSLGSQSSLEIANRLDMSQKQHELYEKPANMAGVPNENANLEVAALQLDAVMDLPLLSTRAGLYVFVNSLLVARPLTDEFVIVNYLHSKYKMEPQNMAADLVTASFDVLANAMYRSEPASTMFCLRSFLINKVPILLSQLSGSIFPLTPEISITQALSRVDPNAFPAFSQSFDDIMGGNSSLSDVRQDFLNACALHGHITASTVERLLGEQPIQGPPANRYEKKALLDQCKNNFDRVNVYIDEMENLDGNAGAIVGAVTEFIAHLCETQVTMHLKQICHVLSKKPQCLDVILQFTSPASILRPLCQFLDDWHYDNDQGEHQPVYDEFGAVLVLIMAFVYRYDLSHTEIGIGQESFIARLMEQGSHSIAPDNLTEEQGRHLASWLKGLYDSGNEGLSNDVFASCRPQDFYLIVPTFFSQTVMACSAGVLSHETVKGGLEYLGETFLLPSLIGGLSWMASHAVQQAHNDLDAMMKMFHDAILTVPSGGDAQAMHSTIIAMVSSRLEKCFRTLQRRDGRTNMEPLLQAIKPYAHYDRSTCASIREVEQWTNAPNSTLETALRHRVQQLCQWASTAAMNPNPPSYTHRQVYAAWSTLGAYQTVRVVVDEVKAQTEAGNGAAALDVGVSIMCAPTVEDSAIPVEWMGSSIPAAAGARTRMNLREMLKHVFENAAPLVARDPSGAEAIARLHRRVEAQVATMGQGGISGPVMSLPNVSINSLQAQTINDDINKAMEEAAHASLSNELELQSMDKKTLERSMEELAGGGGLDLGSMGMAGAGAGVGAGVGAEAGDMVGDMGQMEMGEMEMGEMEIGEMEMGEMGEMGEDGAGDVDGEMSAGLGNLPGLDLGDMGMEMEMDMNRDDDWGLDFDNM